MLLSAVFLLSVAACVYLPLQKPAADTVTVCSDGEIVAVLELSQDTELTVSYRDGHNTVTVKDGKVCVSDADCPDGYCMQYGARSSGLPIICLPNRLVLSFSAKGDLDGVTN